MFSLLNKPRKKAVKRPSVPSSRILDVGGRAMPLTVRENARATRITLRIEPGGKGLKLTVPYGIHHRDVDDFLKRHQGWLVTRLARYRTDEALHAGGIISIRGIRHRIVHTGNVRGLTEAVIIDDQPVLKVSGLEEHIPRRIGAYLKKEARRDMEVLVARHAATIGKSVKSISMKDTRSRWGSCSWQGSLSFSWRIVMAPSSVIDYLAAHEVAHLQEMNHGPGFWALCEKLCPHTDEAKAWLKQHGSQLHAMDFD